MYKLFTTITKWSLMLVLCMGTMYAQKRTVTGTVTNEYDGSGLAGASVLEKGTTNGTFTDAEGKFSLSVEANGVLVVSYVGFAGQEIPVNGQSSISIKMAENLTVNEVVITALGIQKERANVTSSIQQLEGSAIVKAREPNNINGLVGKIAGLTVGASPEMLRAPRVLLRGSSELLYVVDGIPINSDTWNISADDIETYTVLKGATASALYGFRGRNGAIIITTKKGTKDIRGYSVEFNSTSQMESGFIAIPEVQDEYGPGDHGIYEFVDGRGGGKNDNDYDIWGPPLDGRLLPQYDSPIDPVTGKRIPTPFLPRGKDNLKRFLRPGLLFNNNVAVSATGERYNLRFSVSHSYQQGIVPNTQLNITNFNTSLGFDFTEKLRFESNINYNRQFTDNFPDANYGPNSLIYNMNIWGGADWDVDEMKQIWQEGKEGVQQIYAEYQRYNNPWLMAKYWLRGHYKNDIYGYTNLSYTFSDQFKVTARTGVTTYDLFRNEKMPYSAGSYGRDERKGDYREDKRNLFESNTDLIAEFKQDLPAGFNLNILGGGTARIFNYNGNYASTDYLITPGVYNFANSLNPVRTTNFDSKMIVLSAFYSADLSLNTWLTLNHTGRVDKISTLPQENNTFFYPSIGATANVTELVDLGPVNYLKLRGSYANVKDAGNTIASSIGPVSALSGNPLGYGDTYQSSYGGPTYATAEVYTTSLGYNNVPAAFYTNTLGNPNLEPSTRSEYELGFDIGLLQDKMSVDFTYFNIKEGPRIITRTISEASGYTSQFDNGIITRKQGVEITFRANPFKNSKGLKWEPIINFSTFREKYEEFYDDLKGEPLKELNIFTQIGDRADENYGGAYAKDPNGNFIHDASGRLIILPTAQFLGYNDPDFVWSAINRFSYKNFNFSFQFDGRQGGVIGNYIRQQTFRGGRHIETVEGAMGVARLEDTKGNRTWLGEGVQVSNGAAIKYDNLGNITNYGELQFKPNETKTFLQDYISRYYNQAENTIMDRSFAKLREVVIGYTFPLSTSSFFKSANVSLVGRNLLYFAEYKDVDLDQYTDRRGRTDIETPTQRRYGINLNLIF